MISVLSPKIHPTFCLQLDESYLDVYGQRAMQQAEMEAYLIPEITNRLRRAFPNVVDDLAADSSYVKRVLELFDRTEQKLSHLKQLTDGDFKFYFLRPSAADKLLTSCGRELAFSALDGVLNCNEWNLDSFKVLATNLNIKYPELYRILRLTLIDSSDGPPIMELLQFFGKTECQKRFADMINMLHMDKHSSCMQ